jgi:HEPN domain-containing protein
MRRHRKAQQLDMGILQMAAMQAQCFHKNAQGMLGGNVDLDSLNEAFRNNPAIISVFASNLIFAVELYLKTFILGTNGQPPETHDIWRLFNNLKVEHRDLLEREFLVELGKFKNATTINIVINKGAEIGQSEMEKILEAEEKLAPKGDFTDLRRMLKDTRDSYMFWRYMFAKVATGTGDTVVRLHWHHLLSVCNACERILGKAIEKRLAEVEPQINN